MTATEHGRCRPRIDAIDECEWQRIVERARTAGLSVPRLAARRASETGPDDGAAG